MNHVVSLPLTLVVFMSLALISNGPFYIPVMTSMYGTAKSGYIYITAGESIYIVRRQIVS